jgi:ABC-type lipoprotein release transport system permease subunit
MVAYSQIMDRVINRFFLIGSNSLYVVAKGTSIISIIPFSSRLPDNLTDDIRNIQGVSTAYPIIFKDFGNSSSANFIRNVVVGLDFTFLRDVFALSIPLKEGRWPNSGSHEVLLGPAIANSNITVGSEIQIENQSFSVVGILQSDNPIFDKFVYMDYSETQALYNMQGICTSISVFIDPMFSSPSDLNRIKTSIQTDSPLAIALSQQDLQSAAGGFFEAIQLIQTIIAVFPLVICLLFIFVLMLLNVKDHEREFAILQALGIKPSWIGLMVFGQIILTALISFAGSLLIGFLFFGATYNFIINPVTQQSDWFAFSQTIFTLVPSSLYWEMLGLTFILGSGVGFIPTIKAMRVNIITSIRKEE